MEGRLLRPLNDLVFKALFGREGKESKTILIDFLNELLNLDGENRIKEVVYLNPFNLQEFDGDKGSILDLKVKTESGERINIEVKIQKNKEKIIVNIDELRVLEEYEIEEDLLKKAIQEVGNKKKTVKGL